jgi:hypothetical protein
LVPLPFSANFAEMSFRQNGEKFAFLPFTLRNPIVAIMATISCAGSSALTFCHNGKNLPFEFRPLWTKSSLPRLYQAGFSTPA